MPNITSDIKRLIDNAFQRNYHNNGFWTTNELIDFVAEKTDQYLTSRTIRNYIYRLRLDGAPIVNSKDFGYKYSEKWSLSENPLSEKDIKNLRSVINILSQFKGFKFFNDAEVLINKLEEKVAKNKDYSIVFDTINTAKGLNFLDNISLAIENKRTLLIHYQQFGCDTEKLFNVSPFKLIEYNNRWFVFGKSNNFTNPKIGVFALDRINKLNNSDKKFESEKKVVIKNYFQEIIGVTNYFNEKVENVVFKVYGIRANYIETKPIHSSLKIDEKTKDFTIFSLSVKINPELEAFILNLGSDVEVLLPKHFRNSIKSKIQLALDRYIDKF